MAQVVVHLEQRLGDMSRKVPYVHAGPVSATSSKWPHLTYYLMT